MKKLLLVLVFFLFPELDVFAKPKTIQMFERTFSDQNIEISIIPINKSYISKELLNTNILDNQLIGFHIRISNNGNNLYHLLLNQIVYQNVLGEELHVLDKFDVSEIIESSVVAWYWVAGIIGSSIGEYYNKKGVTGLLQYFDDTILAPNSTVSGIICFPFSHKDLYKFADSEKTFRGRSGEIEKSLYVSPYPIKNSKLILKTIDQSSKLVVLSIIFDDNYVKEKIIKKKDKRERINVNELPKEKWPEW